MAQLITATELALVLDEDISDERFNALYSIGLKVIRQGYRGDPEVANPEAAGIIAGVLFGVIARIVANPKGARQLNAGGAGLTFGGADSDIREVFSLTDDERDDLAEANAVNSGTTKTGAFTIRPGA